MVYEVEFTVQEDGEFETVQTALIHAQNVTECRSSALELASGLEGYQQQILWNIQEIEE